MALWSRRHSGGLKRRDMETSMIFKQPRGLSRSVTHRREHPLVSGKLRRESAVAGGARPVDVPRPSWVYRRFEKSPTETHPKQLKSIFFLGKSHPILIDKHSSSSYWKYSVLLQHPRSQCSAIPQPILARPPSPDPELQRHATPHELHHGRTTDHRGCHWAAQRPLGNQGSSGRADRAP